MNPVRIPEHLVTLLKGVIRLASVMPRDDIFSSNASGYAHKVLMRIVRWDDARAMGEHIDLIIKNMGYWRGTEAVRIRSDLKRYLDVYRRGFLPRNIEDRGGFSINDPNARIVPPGYVERGDRSGFYDPFNDNPKKRKAGSYWRTARRYMRKSPYKLWRKWVKKDHGARDVVWIYRNLEYAIRHGEKNLARTMYARLQDYYDLAMEVRHSEAIRLMWETLQAAREIMERTWEELVLVPMAAPPMEAPPVEVPARKRRRKSEDVEKMESEETKPEEAELPGTPEDIAMAREIIKARRMAAAGGDVPSASPSKADEPGKPEESDEPDDESEEEHSEKDYGVIMPPPPPKAPPGLPAPKETPRALPAPVTTQQATPQKPDELSEEEKEREKHEWRGWPADDPYRINPRRARRR